MAEVEDAVEVAREWVESVCFGLQRAVDWDEAAIVMRGMVAVLKGERVAGEGEEGPEWKKVVDAGRNVAEVVFQDVECYEPLLTCIIVVAVERWGNEHMSGQLLSIVDEIFNIAPVLVVLVSLTPIAAASQRYGVGASSTASRLLLDRFHPQQDQSTIVAVREVLTSNSDAGLRSLAGLPDAIAAASPTRRRGRNVCLALCKALVILESEEGGYRRAAATLMIRFAKRGYADCVSAALVQCSRAGLESVKGEEGTKTTAMGRLGQLLPGLEDSRAEILIAEAILTSALATCANTEEVIDVLDLLYIRYCESLESACLVLADEVPFQRCSYCQHGRQSLHVICQLCSRSEKLMEHLVTGAVRTWNSEIFMTGGSRSEQTAVAAILRYCLEFETLHKNEDWCAELPLNKVVLRGVERRLGSQKSWMRDIAMLIGNAIAGQMTPGKKIFLEETINDPQMLDFDSARNWDCKPVKQSSNESLRDDVFGIRKTGQNNNTSLDCDTPLAGASWRGMDAGTEKSSDVPQSMVLEEGSDSDDSIQAFEIDDSSSEEEDDNGPPRSAESIRQEMFAQSRLAELIQTLQAKPEECSRAQCEKSLRAAERLIRSRPMDLSTNAARLLRALLFASVPTDSVEEAKEVDGVRRGALIALLVYSPRRAMKELAKLIYSGTLDMVRRILLLDAVAAAAKELSSPEPITTTSSSSQGEKMGYRTGRSTLAGQGEDSTAPAAVGQSRVWGKVSLRKQMERDSCGEGKQKRHVANRFGPHAATFMLPLMCHFDVDKQGIQMLDATDAPVLARLLHTLGDCILCCAGLPHTLELSSRLFEMLTVRRLLRHSDDLVRCMVFDAAAKAIHAIPSATLAAAMVGAEAEDQNFIRSIEGMRGACMDAAKHDGSEECRVSASIFLHAQADVAELALSSLGVDETAMSQLAQLMTVSTSL